MKRRFKQNPFGKAFKHWSVFSKIIFLTCNEQPMTFIGLIISHILQGIIPIGTAILNKWLFDTLGGALAGKTSINFPYMLLLILIGIAICNIFGQLITLLNNFLSSELNRKLNISTQIKVYKKINSLAGLKPFEDPRFYKIIQLGTQGAQMGPSQILNIFMGCVSNAISLIGFLGVLITYNPLLVVLVFIASIPQLLIQVKIGRQRFELTGSLNYYQRKVGYFGLILSSVTYAKELRLFNLADHFISEFLRLSHIVIRAQKDQQLKELRYQLGLSCFSSLVSSSTMAIVAFQTYAGLLSLGDVTLFINAVTNVQNSIIGFVYNIANLSEISLYFSCFTDLLALPQPIHISFPTQKVPNLNSCLELKNISFHYSDNHPWILQNVNLTIPVGKSVALVGFNGVGKTTLVKLISRLYDPTKGQILWNGIDIKQFNPDEYRKHIGVIFQDFAHFDLTAQENIGLGDVNQLNNTDSIRCAAKWAGINNTISNLPKGYETILSRWLGTEENAGVDLSGGEWQKIALARLFMKSSEFLILDEPTAALDVKSEHEIYSQFMDLMTARASLIISHRFNTVRIANIIAVLENGTISEVGSHNDLINQGGAYAKMYSLQASQYQ